MTRPYAWYFVCVSTAVFINIGFAWSLREELATSKHLQVQLLHDAQQMRQFTEVLDRHVQATAEADARFERVLQEQQDTLDLLLTPTQRAMRDLQKRLERLEHHGNGNPANYP